LGEQVSLQALCFPSQWYKQSAFHLSILWKEKMMRINSLYYVLCILIILSFHTAAAYAGDQELAAASQNPVADLISLPMKNKFNFDAGSENAFYYDLEMQPVYPVHIGNFNLINRLIFSISYQEALYPNMDDEFGLRDLTYQAFLSPAKAGKIIWAAGPAFIIPTNTDDALGNDKWAAGPSFVLLTMPKPWVVGFLAQHFWDFAGDSDAVSVNISSLQYFINYNFPDFYLSTSPTMAYNWYADSDEAWTIPVGGGIGKMFRFGKMPVDLRVSAYWNAEAPESAPDWFAEFQIKLLFPK
jgi:hypothetical protein